VKMMGYNVLVQTDFSYSGMLSLLLPFRIDYGRYCAKFIDLRITALRV